MSYLIEILFYIIFLFLPMGAVVWFLASLILFFQTEDLDIKKRRSRKIMILVSGIVALAVVGGIVALMFLFNRSVSHM